MTRFSFVKLADGRGAVEVCNSQSIGGTQRFSFLYYFNGDLIDVGKLEMQTTPDGKLPGIKHICEVSTDDIARRLSSE